MGLKYGFLGGTFDPIHFGHLNLAISLQEAHQLDAVFFCPTGKNPHKIERQTASYVERKQMVSLALEPFSTLQILDVEGAEEPSYTIDTLEKLVASHPSDVTWYLLLGEDLIDRFHEWKDPKRLLELATPLVACRSLSSQEKWLSSSDPLIKILISNSAPISIMEISSTEVRKRVRNRLPIDHLVPSKIVDFIRENRLY